MNEQELNRVGRIMAGVLRHFPDKFGVEMDRHGWVNVLELVDRMKDSKERLHWIKPYHIEAIVVTDPKGRYELRDGDVRATYGHSIKLDLDLPTENIPDKLYYPVSEEELDMVLERGLSPTDRQKVHLSETFDNAVAAGQHRAESPIILVVDAAAARDSGVVIAKAGKTVFVTDAVPAQFLHRTD
ncbi:MAG: RNA 2'-phosphotransferase [Thermoplasmatota archaeon]